MTAQLVTFTFLVGRSRNIVKIELVTETQTERIK